MTVARIVSAIVIGAFSLYFIVIASTSLYAIQGGGEGDWSADVIVMGCAIAFAAACLVATARLPARVNTMRSMEFYMAATMGIFSIYLMQKSAELPIWWIRGLGPGGGSWSFWLSATMLITCFMILVNWYTRSSPPSQSEDVYMDNPTLIDVGQVAIALIVTVALFHVIGVYFALPLFLIFYVRFFGRHSWGMTAIMAVSTPVVCFFFFDIALKITLPKGLPIIEETFFYPLYKIFL